MDIVKRQKTFEVRLNDRDFKINDWLKLKEWNEKEGYSGNVCYVQIVYILEGGFYGINKGYCVLGLGKVDYMPEMYHR